MKYCPYCGAALMRGAISFCTECGRSIEETSDGTPEPFRIPDPHEETEERQEVIWNLPETKHAPGGKPYDGYYDDIVPEDGMVHEQPKLDKSLALKIGLIVVGVLVVAAICVAVLVLL